MRPVLRSVTAIAAAAALAGGLAACGGSDNAAPAARSGQKPLAAATPDADAVASARKRGFLNESQPPGAAVDQSVAAGEPAESRPCDLVTVRQARAAFGAPVRKPVEGQQGPTCLYRTRSGKGFLSVAVQSLELKQAKPLLKDARKVSTSGRTAYCSETAQSTLYVPLPNGRMLTIGGVPERRVPAAGPRCDLARAFAAKALPQLTS